MKRSAYLEIIDARGVGRKTGLGAAWPTEALTRAAFESARSIAVPDGGFLLDFHDDAGNLVDTIELNAAGVESIVGEQPKSVEAYDEIDRAFWRELRAQRDASQGVLG